MERDSGGLVIGGAQPEKSDVNAIFERVVASFSVVSVFTVVSYAIAFGFEEGYNAFFSVPSDYVAANLLSVFHVLTLVVFLFVNDPGVLIVELLAAAALFFVVPAVVYARHPRILGWMTLVLYCFSTVLSQIALLVIAVAVCVVLTRDTKRDTVFPRVWFVTKLGDYGTKSLFIFLLLLTPLFYFGFRYAEVENPRIVFTEATPPPQAAEPSEFVVARFLSGNVISVKLLKPGESVARCQDQFSHDKRRERLSRSVRILKDDVPRQLTWRHFDGPLNYCRFTREAGAGSEDLPVPLPHKLEALLFVGHGEPQNDLSSPSPAPSPASK